MSEELIEDLTIAMNAALDDSGITGALNPAAVRKRLTEAGLAIAIAPR